MKYDFVHILCNQLRNNDWMKNENIFILIIDIQYFI